MIFVVLLVVVVVVRVVVPRLGFRVMFWVRIRPVMVDWKKMISKVRNVLAGFRARRGCESWSRDFVRLIGELRVFPVVEYLVVRVLSRNWSVAMVNPCVPQTSNLKNFDSFPRVGSVPKTVSASLPPALEVYFLECVQLGQWCGNWSRTRGSLRGLVARERARTRNERLDHGPVQ